MNNLIEIKEFDVLAGTSIEIAVEEAIEKAKAFDSIVKFVFNGINLTVYYFSNIQEKVDEYYSKYSKKG
jgi:hypothetical protein